MEHTADVLFNTIQGIQGDLGVITLNRPKALNALNHEMILAMDQTLSIWEKDPTIKAVIIQAVPGRAFCAGGDVRAIYYKKREGDTHLVNFFLDEYRLNKRIFNYPKPYIAFLNGMTMGGGAGVSIHGSHRIGTENLSFAMPETTIGFFPDIGAPYFLSRLPYKIGYYLGLTGDSINDVDCKFLGLTTVNIPSNQWDNIFNTLKTHPLPDKHAVTELLHAFNTNKEHSTLFMHKEEIERCFSKNSMEEILKNLEKSASPLCQASLQKLCTKSPTSLKVTLAALQKACLLDFDKCMEMQTIIMRQFLQTPDFFEGIRAQLVDKDKNPKWSPATLVEINNQIVAKFF